MPLRLTRRRFLQWLGAGLTLSACQRLTSVPFPPLVPTSSPPPSVSSTPTVTSTVTASPTPSRTPTPTPEPLPPLEVQIGQLLMVGFRGLRVKESDPLAQALQAGQVGMVVLFDLDGPSQGRLPRNIASPDQVQALVADVQRWAALPVLVTLDYEGGYVARLRPRYGFPETASAMALGTQGVEATRTQAQAMARLLRDLDIRLNLAPVVDLCLNPANPIIAGKERCFSAEAELVTDHARAFIAAHHAAGVACTLKHFPGHGSAQGDTHRGWVEVTQCWQPEELRPYQALIAAGLADAVMVAHLFHAGLDAQDPASLSAPIVEGLLRQELGFKDLVISDDLQMLAIAQNYTLEEAVRKALLAGVDVLAFANNSAESYDEQLAPRLVALIRRLVEAGEVPEARIAEAYRRVLAFKRTWMPEAFAALSEDVPPCTSA